MRILSVLFAVGCLLSTAGAQWCEKTAQPAAAPGTARLVLEQMSPAERTNSCISLEFESSDSAVVLLGREVERLWNNGECDEALAQLGDLEARAGHVAIGNSWRKPVPTIETGLWGRDVRLGNRDSLTELSLAHHESSGHLFAALRHASSYPHFSVCMSTDGGATWNETFVWSGSPPTSLDAAVLSNHLYITYNSPGEHAQQVRLRRFLCSSGEADCFRNGGNWVVPCTLDVGDTMREVSIIASPQCDRLHIIALVSDGSVVLASDDASAVSWTRLPTGISSGASGGLDAAEDQNSDTTYVFFSYCDISDTLRIHGRPGQHLSLHTGRGSPSSISAYAGIVICAYEDATSSPGRARYAVNLGSGDTWTIGAFGGADTGTGVPAVTARDGAFAAVYREDDPISTLRFCRSPYDGPWSDPITIAEYEPFSSRPGIVHLGSDLYGVAYLSDTSPVVRGAYFDRSDWVYGVAEEGKPQATSHKLQATVIRGVLLLPRLETGLRTGHDPKSSADFGHVPVSRAVLLDAAGRKVLDLRAGANDVSRLVPGVYFVRSPSPFSSPPEGERVGVRGRQASGMRRDASGVVKIVLTK